MYIFADNFLSSVALVHTEPAPNQKNHKSEKF